MAGLTSAIVAVGAETGFVDVLEMHLLNSLRADIEQARNEPICLTIQAANTDFVADLVGHTSYGWLHLNMLWVAPEHRRQGYGRQLVNVPLERAQSLECHSAWLDTSNPVAFTIWKRLGFSEFGRLENGSLQHPAGIDAGSCMLHK
ncbi:MAG: GNAT family N-acetyltransferase [Rhodobacteraceae bacterium]|nr:GNAT family N-acetyltransferase [Paracoccaceae bacterium]